MALNYDTFIEALFKQQMKNSKIFVADASRLLGLSESAIYNKISGRTKFSLEDALQLTEKYGLSIDEHVYAQSKKQSPLPFYADGLKYAPRSYDDYFNNLLKHFRVIKNINPVWEATYVASDLPIFYYLHFPHLMYMKLYVWNLTTWRIPNHTAYEPTLVLENKPLIKACNEILELFQNFPAKEIWTHQILQRSITQYNYLVNTGLLKDPYAKEKIKNDFNALVDFLEKMTLKGKRLKDGTYLDTPVDIFLNPLISVADFISLHHKDTSFMYVMHDTPNFIMTRHTSLTKYIDDWVQHLMHYSTKISSSGALHQQVFFQHLRKQLEELM